ncbi:hypothetical protein N7530_010424 [Penicillium desertorum]|uniref:Uncharacterized protein n=1 Tax=Penicillium desertorum TaxID=1303715 RepID=A0A9X0BHM6_9EURO|nr:hypothetical protein N7530_010424 [Penicillium desertorum]
MQVRHVWPLQERNGFIFDIPAAFALIRRVQSEFPSTAISLNTAWADRGLGMRRSMVLAVSATPDAR